MSVSKTGTLPSSSTLSSRVAIAAPGYCVTPRRAPPPAAGGARCAARGGRSRPGSPAAAATARAMRPTPAPTARMRPASCSASRGVHGPSGGGATAPRRAPTTPTETVESVARPRAACASRWARASREAVVAQAGAQGGHLVARAWRRPARAAGRGARRAPPAGAGGGVHGARDVARGLLQALDVPEAAERRQRVVEPAARDPQDEVRAAAVAHRDVASSARSRPRLGGADDPVGGVLDVAAPDAQREGRIALDRARAHRLSRRRRATRTTRTTRCRRWRASPT